MTNVGGRDEELKSTGYEIFIGFLSILTILNVALIYLADDPNLDTVIYTLNGLFSFIFRCDFAYRLLTSDSKSRYFLREFGWADLLARPAVPAGEGATNLPAHASFPPTPRIWHQGHRPQPGCGSSRQRPLHSVADGNPRARIRQSLDTASGAIRTRREHNVGIRCPWYVIVRISTVGYGDQFPVTDTGRVVGSSIIIIGVGIFGTFTGYLANVFLSPRKERERQA